MLSEYREYGRGLPKIKRVGSLAFWRRMIDRQRNVGKRSEKRRDEFRPGIAEGHSGQTLAGQVGSRSRQSRSRLATAPHHGLQGLRTRAIVGFAIRRARGVRISPINFVAATATVAAWFARTRTYFDGLCRRRSRFVRRFARMNGGRGCRQKGEDELPHGGRG